MGILYINTSVNLPNCWQLQLCNKISNLSFQTLWKNTWVTCTATRRYWPLFTFCRTTGLSTVLPTMDLLWPVVTWVSGVYNFFFLKLVFQCSTHFCLLVSVDIDEHCLYIFHMQFKNDCFDGVNISLVLWPPKN